MMDDLRDYRFYKTDLVHPNEMAVDYIWELFKETWISESSKDVMNDIEDIQRSLAHRPFDPESDAHKKFIKKIKTLTFSHLFAISIPYVLGMFSVIFVKVLKVIQKFSKCLHKVS